MNAGPNGELQRVRLKKNRGRFAIEVPYLPYSTHTYCNEGELEEEVLYSSVRFYFVTNNCESVSLEYRGQEERVEVEVSCKESQ